MDIKKSLRAGLTICTLVGVGVVPRPTRGSTIIDFPWCTEEYTPLVHHVNAHENLWDISRRYFGEIVRREYDWGAYSSWDSIRRFNQGVPIIKIHLPTKIAKANSLKVSDFLYPGQELVIPGKYSEYHCK